MPQNPYMFSPNGVGLGGMGVGVGMGVPGGGVIGVNMGAPFDGIGNGGDKLCNAQVRLQKMHVDVERLCQAIRSFHTDYETFHNYLNSYNQNKLMMSAQEVRENDIQMEERFNILMARKTTLIGDLRRTITEYDITQELVVNELKNWQRNQALAGNGALFRDNLDDIQRCIEMLVEIVGKVLNFLNVLAHDRINESTDQCLTEMSSHVRNAQTYLVAAAFIVEKQPPQVMKTNTRFAAAVRWLIGPQLGINMNSPTVDCIILSEAQAQRHSSQRTMGELPNGTPASSGKIENNSANMEYQSQTRVFTASFRNMQLKNIKRAEKKGTESVMDEKFALLFCTSSLVNDYRVHVWTLSLPVVVIVHGNQEPQSWATITWDNAFSEIVREPFQVPERVSWSQLSLALNTKFASTTGRPLTDDNLNFLHEKLFRPDVASSSDHKDYITWSQFCKDPLPDRSFTFWDWFFAIMKLTKDHLLGLWKAGLVVGFINKMRTTDEVLRMTRTGTFLLRFSDSELGGISVAFVDRNGVVMMLKPWTARDLQIRGLADRIHDLEILCYIFPTNTSRDEAFREFYAQADDRRTDGYVGSTIRAVVVNPDVSSEDAQIQNQLQSPQHHMQSPQHHMQSPNPNDLQMASDNFNISDFESILY